MTDTHFMTMTIAVHLEFADGKATLKILDNPHVPRNTLATIAWVPTANSEPFEFVGFHWARDGEGLTTPIRLGPAMAALVSNRDSIEIGEWPYRLAVSSKARPGEVIWSSGEKDKVLDPVAGVRNVIARLWVRIGKLSPWPESRADTQSGTPGGENAEMAMRTDGDQTTNSLPPAAAQISSGPMIVTTRV